MRPAVLLAALLVVPFASAQAAEVQRAPYTGQPVGTGCYAVFEAGDCPDLANAAVQFGPFEARTLALEVFDASGRRVGASYVFYDATGVEVGYGTFCGKSDRLRAPAGAAYVTVTLDMVSSPKHCRGPLTFATSGDVVARFDRATLPSAV